MGKKVNELTMSEVMSIVWGAPSETFTRTWSLALVVGLVLFVLGTTWVFALGCFVVCLCNWFWRFYTLDVRK
jgi:hypothetical protein